MDAANKSIGIIILAAGASVRMKQPKQLLKFDNKTLLRRAVETAIAANYEIVVVVLGANFEQTKSEIADFPINICFNENWREGLSSSIKIGLKNLLKIAPEVAACLVSLADQPFITAKHLNLYAEKFFQTNNPIIAAEYNGTIGVPALFSREIFDELCEISGDKGAKMLIDRHQNRLTTINLPEAAFDIDTPEDFAKLNQ